MTIKLFRSGFVLAIALIVLGACVPSEEDFKADHPDPNTSSFACLSVLSGSGSFSNPASLGTAPSCFDDVSSVDVYYSVTIPTTGNWNFKIFNMTGDMDIFVYTSTTFSTLLGSSSNAGTTPDTVTINITDTGTGGIKVDHFSGGTNFFRIEVSQ